MEFLRTFFYLTEHKGYYNKTEHGFSNIPADSDRSNEKRVFEQQFVPPRKWNWSQVGDSEVMVIIESWAFKQKSQALLISLLGEQESILNQDGISRNFLTQGLSGEEGTTKLRNGTIWDHMALTGSVYWEDGKRPISEVRIANSFE